MIKPNRKILLGLPIFLAGLSGSIEAGDPEQTSPKTGSSPARVIGSFMTGGQIWSSPTHDQGTIFVGSDDNCLWALDRDTLTPKWRYITGGRVRSTPEVALGNVFFASDDGFLYCLATEDGRLRWRFDLAASGIDRGLPSPFPPYRYDTLTSSPRVAGGVVFVGSANGYFYAIDSTKGTKRWEFKTGDRIRSTPAVDEQAVYFGSWDHNVYAVEKASGKLIWRFDTGGIVQSSPSIGEGRIYIGSRNPKVFAIDIKTGESVWEVEHQDGSWVESSAVYKNGVVYVGSSDSLTLFALAADTGIIKWKYRTGGWTWSTPAIVDDSILIGSISAFPYYFKGVTLERGLHAVDIKSGEQRWRLPTDELPGFVTGGVMGTPLVVDGMIIFGALDGRLLKVENRIPE